MLQLLKKTTNSSDRKLKKYYKMVEQINALEEIYEKYSDDELKNMTKTFKEALKGNKTIHDIKLDAFAVVREVSKRVLNMRHYDVQLIGGLVQVEAGIAEMATGEGKTLVATLASYVRALEGKGVHVITVNEYLARRDREKMGKVHEFLGLTVGLNLPMMDPAVKKLAYEADITYGLGTEFGFDYLRDNMARKPEDKVQRPYHFAIIDEIDSVLIDEAKTPLIIAGKMRSEKGLYYIAAKLAKRFKQDEDYDFDDETKATSLTEEGIGKVEKAFGVDNLYDLQHQTLYHFVIQAVRAHVMFEKDVDYIVDDGKVQLVDMFTGRIMEGRTLSDGLHQAIEAKEGLEITEENKTQALITIQNYFRMYPFLSGMTGTAKTEEREFREVYGMEVISIPTNLPTIRVDKENEVYLTKEQKYKAIVNKVKEVHSSGQPILIGTTSILQSEEVAKRLKKEKLAFELLNAKSVEQEVKLISMAGQRNQITIATNMAGRGTDIILGEGVSELGGLFVLGTEKHESRRIDNQLRGRAGRQGDPGTSTFIVSLEDDMFKRFAKDDLYKLQKKVKADAEGRVVGKSIQEFIERTQRIVEGSNYSMREYNLKLDDVVNEQRNIIYSLRNKLMSSTEEELAVLIRDSFASYIDKAVEGYCSGDMVEEWDLTSLQQDLQAAMNIDISEIPEIESKSQLRSLIEENKSETESQIGILKDIDNRPISNLKINLTSLIDLMWTKHLENINRLKEGIGLRTYQQEDPIRLYQKEGLWLFTDFYYRLEMSLVSKTMEFIRYMTRKEEA